MVREHNFFRKGAFKTGSHNWLFSLLVDCTIYTSYGNLSLEHEYAMFYCHCRYRLARASKRKIIVFTTWSDVFVIPWSNGRAITRVRNPPHSILSDSYHSLVTSKNCHVEVREPWVEWSSWYHGVFSVHCNWALHGHYSAVRFYTKRPKTTNPLRTDHLKLAPKLSPPRVSGPLFLSGAGEGDG